MTRPNLSGLPAAFIRLGATLALVAGVCEAAGASGSSGTVQVLARILEPIRIEAARAMDFGTLLPGLSPTGEAIYRLAPDGTLTVDGERLSAHAGGQETGRFTFSGSEGQGYIYEAQVTRDFSDSGLTVVAVHAGRVGKSSGSGAFASTQTELHIGGDLQVAQFAALGSHSDAEITLTIAYD